MVNLYFLFMSRDFKLKVFFLEYLGSYFKMWLLILQCFFYYFFILDELIVDLVSVCCLKMTNILLRRSGEMKKRVIKVNAAQSDLLLKNQNFINKANSVHKIFN